jgi:WD40 repeat protein
MLGLDPLYFRKDALSMQWYLSLEEYVIDMAWSSDATRLAAITAEGRVFLIDIQYGIAIERQIGNHDHGGNSVSWNSDGTRLATSGQDGRVQVWDGFSGALLYTIETKDNWVGKVAYHPEQPVLAFSAGRTVKCWNEFQGIIYESSGHASTIADIGWHPEGSVVAVAAYNGVTVHAPFRQSSPRKFYWKGSSLLLSWSPDARYIATGEQDSTVHFWYVDSGTDAQMWGFDTKVLELSWHSSGRWLATGGGISICVWDCRGNGPAGRTPQTLECHFNKITQIAYQPRGHYLASTDMDRFLLLWEPEKHDKLVGATSLSAPASCVRWTPQGNKLAIGQNDGVIASFVVNPDSQL